MLGTEEREQFTQRGSLGCGLRSQEPRVSVGRKRIMGENLNHKYAGVGTGRAWRPISGSCVAVLYGVRLEKTLCESMGGPRTPNRGMRAQRTTELSLVPSRWQKLSSHL